jgi:hypothetical protein
MLLRTPALGLVDLPRNARLLTNGAGMRLVFAILFAAAASVAPGLAGAIDVAPPIHVVATPAPVPVKILAPQAKLLPPTPSPAPVTGPPQNPSTPTIWMKPQVGHQVILSNISENMSAQGSHGCMQFTISASLNAADAITVLGYYTAHVNIEEAFVYAPPVVYVLKNASIKSYTESDSSSGSRVTMTLNEQQFLVAPEATPAEGTVVGC